MAHNISAHVLTVAFGWIFKGTVWNGSTKWEVGSIIFPGQHQGVVWDDRKSTRVGGFCFFWGGHTFAQHLASTSASGFPPLCRTFLGASNVTQFSAKGKGHHHVLCFLFFGRVISYFETRPRTSLSRWCWSLFRQGSYPDLHNMETSTSAFGPPKTNFDVCWSCTPEHHRLRPKAAMCLKLLEVEVVRRLRGVI